MLSDIKYNSSIFKLHSNNSKNFKLNLFNVDKQNILNELLMNKEIIGTYIMGDEKVDAEYFVFDKDNNYYRYKQFQFLENGQYENIHDDLYILKNDSKEYIVYNNEDIYYFNSEQNNVRFYSKIADNSLFINVPDINK